MSLLYEARDLKKYYGGRLVLDIPLFRLEQDAMLIIEGANGSGKSTFLRLLAFLEEPTSGSLQFFAGSNPRRHCSLLLQEPWLMRSSVFANVTLGLKLRGIRDNLENRYHQAMRAAGFENPELFAKRRPGALSGGEKQRAALAARLIFNPAALLLDEPTAYVDAASAGHIIKTLLCAHEKGITIICSTHDESLAAALGAEKMKMRKPG